MERPDVKDTVAKAVVLMNQLERLLEEAQEKSSRSRLGVMMAVELSGAGNMSFDQIIKTQIYGEAMGHTFARILEARTHLGVAMKALSDADKG